METIMDDGMYQQVLHQKIVEMLDKLKLSKLGDYNLFLLGPQRTGKTGLINILSTQQHHQQEHKFFEINLPQSQDEQNLLQTCEMIYLMNNSVKSLVVIVFHAFTIGLNKSKSIFDSISKFSNGVKNAFLIFNKSSKNIQAIQGQFINNYNEYRKNLNQSTTILIDRIISDQNIIFLQDSNIQNDFKQKLLDKRYYHRIQIEYNFNSNDYEQIKYYGSLIKDNINQLYEWIILFKIQSNISNQKVQLMNLKQKNDQLEVQINDDLEKFNKYLEIFVILKIFQFPSQNKIYEYLKQINSIFTNIKHFLQDDTLQIINTQYTTQQLLELYDLNYSNAKINSIFIYALSRFKVNCDIKFPGVSIYIYTYEFDVQEDYTFDLSGIDGQPYQTQARSGIYSEDSQISIHGEHGKDGILGQNGGSFTLNSKTTNNFERIQFKLNGGNGGDGQDGGNGANGGDGLDPEIDQVNNKNPDYIVEKKAISSLLGDIFENVLTFNKTYQITYRSCGTQGQIGGNSGSGGLGGHDGFKGKIYINDYKIRKINESKLKSIAGKNGKKGIPGRGGKVGQNYEGICKQVLFFGCLRSEETEKGLLSKSAVTAGAVGIGLKQLSKSAALLFLEEQAIIRTIAGATGGAALLVGQAVFSAIHIGITSQDDWIKIGYVDTVSYNPSGKVESIQKESINKNQLEKQQFLQNMQKQQEFKHFVKQINNQLKTQLPQLTQFKDLLRYEIE